MILLNRRSWVRKSFATWRRLQPAFFLAAMAISCSGTVTPSADKAVNIRIVASGTDAQARDAQSRAVTARDSETFQQLWSSLIGGPEIPYVDFSRDAVIILLGGERSTGGYSINPRGASLRDRALVVDAPVEPPPPDAMTTQALTYPFAVIAVDQRDFDRVEWQP